MKIEKPIEKIVEIPVEQVIEIPVEKIIEVPVERKNYVERVYETVLEKPYDVIKENIITKDNIVDIPEEDLEKYLQKNPQAQVLPVEVQFQER